MAIRRAVGIAVAVVLVWSTYASAAGMFTLTHVTVRLYDAVGLNAAVTRQVRSGVADTFGSAGVEVTWLDCSSGAAAACRAPLGAGELTVRIVTLPAPAGHDGPVPLADALIDRRLKSGVLATVYFDRVQTVAQNAGTDVGDLLAHTVAHEIAHLLAGTDHHDSGGLMRPVWTVRELRRNESGTWAFEPRH